MHVMSALRIRFYFLCLMVQCLTGLGVNSEPVPVGGMPPSSTYELVSIQMLTSDFPTQSALDTLTMNVNENYVSGTRDPFSARIVLTRRLTSKALPPVKTPVCGTMGSFMKKTESMDVIYYSVLSAKALQCSLPDTQLIVTSLVNLLKSSMNTEYSPAASGVSSSYDDLTRLNTITSSPDMLLPWTGVYKAVSILVALQKTAEWSSIKSEFTRQLLKQLERALLSSRTSLDSHRVLEMANLFLSLVVTPQGENDTDVKRIAPLLETWCRESVLLPASDHPHSALYAFTIDSMLHRVMPGQNAFCLSSRFSSVVRDAIGTLQQPKYADVQTKINDVLLLRGLSNATALKFLLPLLPEHVTINIRMAQAEFQSCEGTDLSDPMKNHVCAHIKYCPLGRDELEAVPGRTLHLPPTVSVLGLVHEKMLSSRIKVHKNSALKQNVVNATSKSGSGDTCLTVGIYRIPEGFTAANIDELLIEHANPNTPPSSLVPIARLTRSYFSTHPQLQHHEMYGLTKKKAHVTVWDSRSQLIPTEARDFQINVDETYTLQLKLHLLKLKDNPSFSLYNTSYSTSLINSIEPEKAPEFVGMLITVVDTIEVHGTPVTFATVEDALNHRPFGSPSDVTLRAVVQNDDNGPVYVTRVNFLKLISDLNLLPGAILRVEALVAGKRLEPLRHFVGLFNISSWRVSTFPMAEDENRLVIESPNKRYYTVTPEEAFWHPKPLIYDKSPNEAHVKKPTVTLVFLLLVLLIPGIFSIFLFRVMRKHYTFSTLSLTQLLCLAYLLLVMAMLVVYWVNWTFLYFLKLFVGPALVGIIIANLSVVRSRPVLPKI